MAVLISCIGCGLDCLIFPGKRLSPVKAGVLNIVVWLRKYSCKAVYRSRSKLFQSYNEFVAANRKGVHGAKS